MTIVFQGHVRSITEHGAPLGKLTVLLATPMADTNGADWTVMVPKEQAQHWLPGRMVCFTIYTQPPAVEA